MTTYRMMASRPLGLTALALTAASLISLATAQPATAQTPIQLYNTGVNNDGTVAAVGTTDLHYTQVSPAGNSAVFTSGDYAYAAPTDSQYDSPDIDFGDTYLGGVYTVDYQTTFDLTGLVPSTAVITGEWSVDNLGDDILINGHSTGLTSPGFSAFTPFDLTPFQSDFQAGVNTLDFVWENQGGPGAIDVQGLTGFGAPAPPVPEASTTVSLGLLLALGLGGLVVAPRRKKTNGQAASAL